MRSLLGFLVKYPIWSNVLVLLILIGGLAAFFDINRSRFPELESRIITISVVQPGASPEEMDRGVVLKVEEAVKGIKGIEEIRSVSRENSASITVEGKRGYDPDKLLVDVKNAVDRINSFPENAEKPIVQLNEGFNRAAGLILKGNVSLYTLKDYAELIEDQLLASEIISNVGISGIPAPELSVEVSEEVLQRYELTFTDISTAIKLNNANITAGAVKGSEEELLIRSNARSYEPEGLANIPLRTLEDGRILRIGDIGTVRDTFTDVPDKILFNGKNAVSITVNKLPEEDVVAISNEVREYAEEFNQTHTNVQLEMVFDGAEDLKQRQELLLENGAMGIVLVLIALGLFLNLRLSFWVSMGIPFSFAGMFIIAWMSGITINLISLFGMILVIGIIVDDGIVIGENIYAQMEKGKSALRASIDGTLDVLPSVFTSVTTTILVFVPFFFMDGRVVEFMAEMAMVVIACLAMSLVECTFVLPAHLSEAKVKNVRKETALDKGLEYLRKRVYAPMLRFTINNKLVTFGLVIFIFLATAGLVGGGLIRFTFFPFIDGDEISVNLVLKPGTPPEITEHYLREIEKKVWIVNQRLSEGREDGEEVVENVRIQVGTSDLESGGHTGKIEVGLMEGEQRDLASFVISGAVQKEVGVIPVAEKVTYGARRIFGKPVSISLQGSNIQVLEAAKEDLQQELSEFSNLKDITDNNVVGKKEIMLKLKPQAYLLGLTRNEVARQVRQGFFGEEVERIQRGDDEVRIWVRYPIDVRNKIGDLETMRIKTPAGESYRLDEVVEYRMERGIVVINHVDLAREIKVEADLVDQNEPVPPILEKIREDVIPELSKTYPSVRFVFEGQQEENEKFFGSAKTAYGFAAIAMILVITLTFRSFSQAGLILSMIPLGILGAVLGHGIVRLQPGMSEMSLSIFSIFGILALSGIIINDAVVFLDRFNLFLKQGMTVKEAVYEAGLARFRAILLTSVTTVVGLYPLILNDSRQAQFLIPMAISVAYGVLIGTFFILLFFPVVILAFNQVRRAWYWVWKGEWPDAERVEPAVREKKRLSHLNGEQTQ